MLRRSALETVMRCTLLHDGHAQGHIFTLANLAIEAALAHQGVAIGRESLVSEWILAERLVMPFKHKIKSPMRYIV